MNTTDWNFDFSSLQRWNNRETTHDIYDRFYEIPQNDALCCLYSITEARMGDYRGFLAILKDKESPSVLVDIASGMNFCDNFSVSADGNLLFLMPHIYDPRYWIICPILIIDLQHERFSYLSTGNINPYYKIMQKSDQVFTVEASETQRGDQRLMAIHGMQILPEQLPWHDLDQLHSLPDLVIADMTAEQTRIAMRKKQKIALGITAGALAILIGLFGLVQLFLNNKKDTEEYRIAYSYLIGSSAFQQMHAEESDIRLNQYALRTHTGTEDHFSSGQTVEITFTVIYRSFTVICHKQDGHWVVCEYCTQFE